jgi:EAL domain-containing protein (putative c-di-GMP-specific phosphodiesterase class I)
MRGIDADGRLIPPGRMFDAARVLERTAELDARCQSAALREIGGLNRGAPRGLTYFINFVPGALADARRSLGAVMDAVNAGGLRPGQVVFEVVETDKVQSRRELQGLLRTYRKAGFKVALDDVGAGYSSLLSLGHLRPDYIKLDGELVRRAATSALEAKMVRDLAETARQNGIIAIAEGIETADHLRLAMSAGIRITQGYLHARPQPRPLTGDEAAAITHRAAEIAAGRAEIAEDI